MQPIIEVQQFCQSMLTYTLRFQLFCNCLHRIRTQEVQRDNKQLIIESSYA